MTEVDASIPLQAKGIQLEDPTTLQAKMLSLRQLGLQTQQAQQDFNDNQTLRSLYQKHVNPDGSLDQNGLLRDVYGAGLAKQGIDLQQRTLGIQKTQADIGESNAKASQANASADSINLATTLTKVKQVAGTLYTLANTKYQDTQAAAAAVNQLVNTHEIPPDRGAEIMRNMPGDPTQIPSYFQRLANQGMTIGEQIENHLKTAPQVEKVDTGNGTMLAQRNPLTGAITNGPTVAKGVSPDTSANINKDYAIAGLNPDGTPGQANAALVKMIGENRIVPSDRLESTPRGQAVLAEVEKQYPGYDRSTALAKVSAAKDFTTGKDAASLRSIGTATKHLDMLDGLVTALDNGNTPLFNQLSNSVGAATGSTAPGNFDAAKDIVGKEVIKGIVAGGGGVGEREEASKALSSANTPAQLRGVIATYKTIMGAQQESLLQQRDAAGLSRSTLPDYTEKSKGAIVPIKSDADYNALPSGTVFQPPDGSPPRRKP